MALRSCKSHAEGPGAPEVFSPAARQLTHMVMVAGHSVYTGADYAQAANNDNWYLMDYQKVPGTAQSFVQHIETGVKVGTPHSCAGAAANHCESQQCAQA